MNVHRFLLLILYNLTALLILFLCWRQVSSLDVGFHLHAGKWIIENKSFPNLDTFSFTVNGTARYLDFNWLYQVILQGIYSLFSYPGLVAMNTFLVLASFFLVIFRCKIQGVNWDLKSQLLLIVTIISISILYEIRPHVFSWVLLNLVLLCLEDYSKNKNVKSLVALPFLMMLWVNIPSLFILGLICIVCYFIASWLKNLKSDRKLTAALIFSLVACLFNPYTYLSLFYPLRQFKLLGADNPFNQSISELSSSLKINPYVFYGQLKLFNPLSFYHLLLIVCVILFIRKFRQFPLPALFVIIAFSYIGITAVKNTGYHLFAVLPYFIYSLSAASLDTKKENTIRTTYLKDKFANVYAPVISILLLVYLLINITTNRFYIAQRLTSSFGNSIDTTGLPVKAALFLSEKKISEPVLNHLNVGSYMMHATPNKVFIDGRLEVYGEQFYKSYLELSGPQQETYFKQFTDTYQVKAIFFPYEISPSWVHYLKKNPDWRLVYYDEIAAIYLKSGYRPDITTVDSSFVRNSVSFERVKRNHEYYIHHKYPAHFFKRQFFPSKEKALSYFMYLNDWNDQAIRTAEQGLLSATAYYPELLFNLGSYYYKKKMYHEASLCYNQFLKTNDHPVARKRSR